MDPEYQARDYRIAFQEEEKWKKYLQDYGFVVIASYLPEAECRAHVDGTWKIMETLSDGKIQKDKPKTHKLDENYPPMLHGGMIQYVGHSQTQWNLRLRCKSIFQKLWQSENLKTSFDGFCFMNGVRRYEQRPQNAFLHTDQSPKRDYLWSYQGIMTLTDSG